MKKNYEELELKVIRFASEDVITASGDGECKNLICKDLICTKVLVPCTDMCRVVECVEMICKSLGCMDMCEM